MLQHFSRSTRSRHSEQGLRIFRTTRCSLQIQLMVIVRMVIEAINRMRCMQLWPRVDRVVICRNLFQHPHLHHRQGTQCRHISITSLGLLQTDILLISDPTEGHIGLHIVPVTRNRGRLSGLGHSRISVRHVRKDLNVKKITTFI